MFRVVIVIFSILVVTICHAQTHTLHIDKDVYKSTITRWLDALDKFSIVPSTTYATKKVGGEDKLHRAGHRDLLVWIPNTTNLSKDFTVVLWFHGHRGYIQHRTFQDRILKQFVPHTKPAADGKNFVVVLPEMPWSINTKTPTKRNGKLWEKPGDFLKFIISVEGILVRHLMNQILEGPESRAKITGLGKIDYRVIGHSAGGSTIATLGHTGDLCKINPSLVVWSDASYGGWLAKAWNGCLEVHNIRTEVFVKKWGPPWRRSTKFMGEFQGQPKYLHLHVKNKGWSHKKIGNNIVKLSGILD